MVFNKGSEWPPIICPTLIAEKEIKTIDDLKLSEIWNARIQVPEETDPESKFAMLNQITVFNIDKLPESGNLIELPEVQETINKIAASFK